MLTCLSPTKMFALTLVLLFIIRLRFPAERSIASIIKVRYGNATLQLIRKYESTDLKYKKCELDIEFIENCIKHELFPTFVRFKVSNSQLRNSKVHKDCQLRLLHQELLNKKSKLSCLKKRLFQLKVNVRNALSWIDFAHVSNLFLKHNDKVLTKTRLVQEKKLINLGLRTAHETNDPEKVIFNFSSRVLTSAEKSLLAKGLNLSIPPKLLNYADALSPFEVLYREIEESNQEFVNGEKEAFKASLKNIAFDFLHKYDPKVEQNLPPNEVAALKSLLKDNSIIIQKSDKGNSVVILDKTAYIERVTEILADTSKFQKLNVKKGKDFNYVRNQEKRITSVLYELNKKGSLSDADYNKLKPKGSAPSVLYGLSKVHKTVIDNKPKQRPILSAINTPTYNLSKFLVKILEPFTKNNHTARDSFTFANEVRSQNTQHVMASLDVEALFTNIPLEETIDICVELVFSEGDVVHGLNREDFRTLLSLATKESFIVFNGSYYKQIDGVAMGSPLGPTFANVFLCYHEEHWLSSCPADFKPKFYRRYVDDIFLLFDKHEHVDKFKAYMNSRHHNMKFTSELEELDLLPFLDIKVIRAIGQFTTSVYRKPTFSGVYTNYSSFLPEIYKSGLIRTLLFRLYTICSDWQLIHQEIEHLRTVMRRNAYPDRLIDSVIHRFLAYLFAPKDRPDLRAKDCKTFQIYLPFLGSVSSRTEKAITKAFQQFIPNCRIRIITTATTRLRTLFSFKDKIPKYLSSRVVYKFTCGNCKATYIGKTKRHSKTRYCEHFGISDLTGKTVKTIKQSAISDHRKTCHSRINFDAFTTLGRDNNNNWHLLLKESLFIQRDNPVLNAQVASVPLKLF